jgi:hypothetical protein
MVNFNENFHYSLTLLIRTTQVFQTFCPDLLFHLMDNPEFPHQNVKDTIFPD